MTNEQIVSEIRNGYSVTDYMQLLYESNLLLIKKFIKPYTAYEPMEDLLQESYFGLWEAVQHYETSANVRFMTYAEYWIRQSVRRYLEKCGSTVRIPSHKRIPVLYQQPGNGYRNIPEGGKGSLERREYALASGRDFPGRCQHNVG